MLLIMDNSVESPSSLFPVRLSVVLPVRNGEPYLRHQLRALASQQCSFPWEVIVVDNGSTDGSAETAKEFEGDLPNLQILSEPRRGKPYALNAGIAVARGELLVLVDADDEVGDGYLEAMGRALEKYELVSASIDTKRLNPVWARAEIAPADRLVLLLGFRIYVPGALIGIRSSACERIGGFATDLSMGEDVDFTWRAQLLGITTGLAPDAILHFRRPPDAWGNFRRARRYGRAFVRMYVRYRDLGQPRRGLGEFVGYVRWMLTEALRGGDHWQWTFAWWAGHLEGRLEESLRQRVWFP